MQAFTKKPMKPSLMPCFFSKPPCIAVRNAMTCVMSTSLKVVSIAAVFCASFSRRAMVWRSRVIRTRSSRAASSARRRGARSCDGGCRCGHRRGCAAALRWRRARRLWSPAVLAGARNGGGIDSAFCSDLRTDGAGGFGRGFGVRRRAAAGAGSAAWQRLRGLAGSVSIGCRRSRAAPSLIAPSRAPTATVSPSLTAISRQHAGCRRGTSMRDLVGFEFDQRLVDCDGIARLLEPLAIVASVTDSPNVGTESPP